MKTKVFLVYSILVIIGCRTSNNDSLQNYLLSFSEDIKCYRVICFVPADGCSSCIDPAINYSRKRNNGFLLVLSSTSKKSLDNIIKDKNLKDIKLITDSKNTSVLLGFTPLISPCLYFIKNGIIVKKIDLTGIQDKEGVFKYVDEFLIDNIKK